MSAPTGGSGISRPSPMTRRLTADERREVRVALSARKLRLAELIAEGKTGLRATYETVDGLLGQVDEMRVEVPR